MQESSQTFSCNNMVSLTYSHSMFFKVWSPSMLQGMFTEWVKHLRFKMAWKDFKPLQANANPYSRIGPLSVLPLGLFVSVVWLQALLDCNKEWPGYDSSGTQEAIYLETPCASKFSCHSGKTRFFWIAAWFRNCGVFPQKAFSMVNKGIQRVNLLHLFMAQLEPTFLGRGLHRQGAYPACAAMRLPVPPQ